MSNRFTVTVKMEIKADSADQARQRALDIIGGSNKLENFVSANAMDAVAAGCQSEHAVINDEFPKGGYVKCDLKFEHKSMHQSTFRAMGHNTFLYWENAS